MSLFGRLKRAVTPPKRLRKAIAKAAGQLGKLAQVAAPIAGAAFGGPAGFAAGAALTKALGTAQDVAREVANLGGGKRALKAVALTGADPLKALGFPPWLAALGKD